MYGYFFERNYKGDLPYTDLALERRRANTELPGVEYKATKIDSVIHERVKISTKIGAESIGRPIGIYDTLSTERFDKLDKIEADRLIDILGEELSDLFDDSGVFPGRILVVGLGNPNLTPDALGPKCASKVKATMQIKEHDKMLFDSLSCAEIAVSTPNVAASSGLDAVVMITGLCDLICPDAVLAIDALATRDASRLGSTIQICNSGISPGSGLGNGRLALCSETVGVPVFAIGVPTVIDSRLLCPDCSMTAGEPMSVTPREINQIIDSASEIIGGGINRAFGIYY